MTSEEIKERVSVRDVLQQHGVKIRRNMCSCPFHKDVNPSMAIYENTVKCFSCGFSGDVFALTEKMDNCSFKEAFLALGGDYKPSKDADYFRAAKKSLQQHQSRPVPSNESHSEMIQRWTRDAHDQAHNILKALQICYSADLLEPLGSDKWHYLKSITGYLEEMYDNDEYDWRVVEKILSEYAGKKRYTREQVESDLKEEILNQEIEGSTEDGISTQ